jgi:hypothetical protein
MDIRASFNDYGDRNYDDSLRRLLSEGCRPLAVKEVLTLREQAISSGKSLDPGRDGQDADRLLWLSSHMTGDCIAHHRGRIKVIPHGMATIVNQEHVRISRGDYLLGFESQYAQLPGKEFEIGFDNAEYELDDHPIVRSVWHALGVRDDRILRHREMLACRGLPTNMGIMFAYYWQPDSEDAAPIVRPLRVCAAKYGSFLDNMYPCDSSSSEVPDNHIMGVP